MEKKLKQRPKYRRAEFPPPMRFQDRDLEIMYTIHEYDGMVARRHIKSMFWANKSNQAMENRLSKLFHNGYLDWPNVEQRKIRPIPEPIVWLGWRGALVVAQAKGIEIKPPTSVNENQMRLLQAQLRKNDIRWVREPNWIQTYHDLTVIDFRLAVERSTSEIRCYRLDQWVPESAFRMNTDRISFSFSGKDGKLRKKKRGICPDGFFILVDEKREKSGKPNKARFLLEIDMATHDNPSFGIEKIAAGAAYIDSQEYKDRFGANAGRWLIITTGIKRMKNLMKQVEQNVKDKSYLFYFSCQEKIQTSNLICDPVWWQVKDSHPRPLPLKG